jgi:hypothetical protein
VDKCDGTSSTTTYDTTSNHPEAINGTQEVMDDVVVKDFFRRKAKGEIFNNPMSKGKYTYSFAFTGENSRTRKLPCSGTTIKQVFGSCPRGLYSWNWIPLKPWAELGLSTAVTTAGTQAWANVVQPQVLSGEPLREWDMSWHMLRHPLDGVHQFLRKVHRKKSFRKSGLALGEFIGGYWLQYRYGLVPLLSDLMSAFDAAVMPRFSDRYTARGSASVAPWSDSDTETAEETYYTANTYRTIRQEGWVRAGILYRHHYSTADVWGLSAHNIPQTLWELTRLSFVVDWFVNAGDFIGAFTPKANVEILASWTSIHKFIERENTMVGNPKTDSVYYIYGGPGVHHTEKTELYERYPGAARGLTVKLQDLSFEKTKNLLHLGDGLALAGQALSHRFNGRELPTWKPNRSVRGRSLSNRGEYLLPQNPL